MSYTSTSFLRFHCSRASDKCQREKRKTINGDDLLWAMSTLGFEDYVEPLKVYLLKYREVNINKGEVTHISGVCGVFLLFRDSLSKYL